MKRELSSLTSETISNQRRRTRTLTIRGAQNRRDNSLINDNSIEREQRLATDRNRKRVSRENETEEERQNRLASNRDRSQQSRENETEEERQVRLETERNRIRQNRDNETEEQALNRLEEDRIRHRLAYEEEQEGNMANRLNEVIVGGLHLWAFYDRDHILNENTIEPFNCGIINSNNCDHCGARMFTAEKRTRRLTFCCKSGKVELEAFNQVPDFVKELFCTANNQNIRSSDVIFNLFSF